MARSGGRWAVAGLVLCGIVAAAAFADRATSGRLLEAAFDAIAHLFYEQPLLARIRRPTQLVLVRWHGLILLLLIAAGFLATPWLGRHARGWWGIVCAGYAVRALVWVVGGNLPLVPGDSCHYLEVATSVYRGEGAVKHYVESYFRDYPEIRAGRGILDDWATPLYAYALAGAYRLTGVEPSRSLESTVAVAKGTSFLFSLLALPALYGFARRRYDRDVALAAMAVLAILPVHAIYAGFALRESLVALTSILAIWLVTEVWHTPGRAAWGWAIAAGVAGGLAILARNTAMALLAAGGLYGLVAHSKRRLGPLLLWGIVVLIVIAPWGWATYQVYGEPFYTYTKFFPYNFSWTVHHAQPGITRAADFYTWANAPEILRVKLKSLTIIAVTSVMILSLPLVLGFARRFRRTESAENPESRDTDRLILIIAIAFVLGTLANVADVTQVAQLGRYYLPIFALALPPALAGLRGWLEHGVLPAARCWLAAMLIPLLWADPTWAYDASWFVKPYQLHWPALRAAGDWVEDHPEQVPAGARILTWFPWEFRVASQRTTILFPRSYHAPHIERAMRDYRVTHVLWGSFEPPPHADPEEWGRYLERLRLAIGLTDRNEIYRTPADRTFPYFPVRLYRVSGAAP